MLVRFLYTDHSIWEGLPEDAHKSLDPRPPDGGIIRMTAIDDCGNELRFTYQDLYYLHPEDGEPGCWRFGEAGPKREFVLRPGQDGCEGSDVPVVLPEGTVVRYGCTVSQEEAVKFGLIEAIGDKTLHEKRAIAVECKDCG